MELNGKLTVGLDVGHRFTESCGRLHHRRKGVERQSVPARVTTLPSFHRMSEAPSRGDTLLCPQRGTMREHLAAEDGRKCRHARGRRALERARQVQALAR